MKAKYLVYFSYVILNTLKMKRFYTILMIISFLIGSTYASEDNKLAKETNSNSSNLTSINGVVLDKHTGEALAGVKVVIAELNKEVYTDLEGNFEFKNMSKDIYSIESEMISYEKQNLKVDLNISDNLKIVMENK